MIESIPREHWADTCRSFVERHRGWLAHILRTRPGAAAGAARDGEVLGYRPLHDIRVEGHGPDARVSILTADGDTEVEYPVSGVRSLLVERRPDGSETGLQLEDARGVLTLIRFRVTAAPETLDGLAPDEL